MPRIVTKIGDVYRVRMDNGNKKYLQYVANDLTQLNSDVVRVFKKEHPAGYHENLPEITNGEVDFYAHCVTKWGIKLGYWEKIGNFPDVGKVDAIFRDTNDYGNLDIKVSTNWYIWQINEPFKQVGKLIGDLKNAEIGVVIPPDSIVHRMKTGVYDFVYPQFE